MAENHNLIDLGSDTISIRAIEARATLIEQLDNFINGIATLTTKARKIREQALARCKEETAAISDANERLKKICKKAGGQSMPTVTTMISLPPTDGWTEVKKVRKREVIPKEIESGQRHRVKITQKLSLMATPVGSFADVQKNGELYWIESAKHFAIRIAGVLLHGNIGTIYTDEKNPCKIKDCRFAPQCIKHDKCDYYHDPKKFAGSEDHRNFIAGSWLYASPTSPNRKRGRCRQFGSLHTLDEDIVGMTSEDISRYQDQTLHDILCSLLLAGE